MTIKPLSLSIHKIQLLSPSCKITPLSYLPSQNVEPILPDLKGKKALVATDMYQKAKLLATE